ncbi:bifunctional DNA primase/polymerase [Nocardia brasiliensis]|uniref:bifunctional DNA primase/polymerase n=1 Tax=Nocardia brasiliensis TaxID=37326 RepID=UPI002456540B|nr:bifunctional DNA primase/polymerase [Nocardia brasiliensis]
MSKSDSLPEAALQAAARGWSVFPLRPLRKTPALKGSWARHATTDLEQIRSWWRDNPRRNIAIATGVSNLHVIDIDRTNPGDDLLTRLSSLAPPEDPLPPTYTVQTPHGRHLYFQAPPQPVLGCTVGRVAPGIDSRGIGGYVVAAGSLTSHGTYQILEPSPVAVLPSWLTDRLAPPPPPPIPAPRPTAAHAYLTAILTREAARVSAAEHHTRNKTLFRAAFTLGRLVAGGELLEHDVRTALTTAASRHIGQHCFTATELDRTLTNGLTYGAHYPRHLTPKASSTSGARTRS